MKGLEVKQMFIVTDKRKNEILFVTDGGYYFVSNHGAFGQRPMEIDPISKEQADLLLRGPEENKIENDDKN